jgi:hypothetical protein
MQIRPEPKNPRPRPDQLYLHLRAALVEVALWELCTSLFPPLPLLPAPGGPLLLVLSTVTLRSVQRMHRHLHLHLHLYRRHCRLPARTQASQTRLQLSLCTSPVL